MNEAEKHYAGQGGGTGLNETNGQGAATRHGGSSHGAAAGARDGLKSAAEAARSAAETVRETASEAYERATRRTGELRRRSASELTRRRRGIEAFVEENPVMVGVAGLAAGLLIGSLLPSTRRENQVFGRYADEVREQGMRYARELAEQGKSMVEENLQAATRGGREERQPGEEGRAA
ncbi:hypothetical protein [Enterovirga sp. CN4-39]|uniref:hypothetical protein n=1 Tax=Enterovirga sp. CN4-39 TaxID=3400910 RepID=UPI003C104272